MRINAITLANWFVDKAESEKNMPSYSNELTVLRLVKLVYIAYGFTLAIADRNVLDERFDKVEAWKFGPVIPSVYFSFRHNQSSRIVNCEGFVVEKGNGFEWKIPKLADDEEDIECILNYVWNRYIDCDAKKLVSILHMNGTPWSKYFIPGQNREIPENATKEYYKTLVNVILGKE